MATRPAKKIKLNVKEENGNESANLDENDATVKISNGSVELQEVSEGCLKKVRSDDGRFSEGKGEKEDCDKAETDDSSEEQKPNWGGEGAVEWPWLEVYDSNTKEVVYVNCLTNEKTTDRPKCPSGKSGNVCGMFNGGSCILSDNSASSTNVEAPLETVEQCIKDLHGERRNDKGQSIDCAGGIVGASYGSGAHSDSEGLSNNESCNEVNTAKINGNNTDEFEISEKSNDKPRRGLGPEVDYLLIFVEHNRSPTATELGRKARKQMAASDAVPCAYIEGGQDYNIWYDRYLSDRFEDPNSSKREKVPASTKCNPFLDSGWTRANFEISESERPRICLFFAKGCCTLGSDCKYLHRVPTVEDNSKLDMLHDIFGRERHKAHRDDMDGVGSFNSDCKTLFVGDLRFNRALGDHTEKVELLLRRSFGLWGKIESIRVIPNKNIAFVKYAYRVASEFAKVAMCNQPFPFLEDSGRSEAAAFCNSTDSCITVRWAYSNRNAAEKEADDEADRAQARAAVEKRMRELGYSESEIYCYGMWGELPQSTESEVTSLYPFPMVNPVATCFDSGTNPGAANDEAQLAIISSAPQRPCITAGESSGCSGPPYSLWSDNSSAVDAPNSVSANAEEEVVDGILQMQEVLSKMPNVDHLDDAAFEVVL